MYILLINSYNYEVNLISRLEMKYSFLFKIIEWEDTNRGVEEDVIKLEELLFELLLAVSAPPTDLLDAGNVSLDSVTDWGGVGGTSSSAFDDDDDNAATDTPRGHSSAR